MGSETERGTLLGLTKSASISVHLGWEHTEQVRLCRPRLGVLVVRRSRVCLDGSKPGTLSIYAGQRRPRSGRSGSRESSPLTRSSLRAGRGNALRPPCLTAPFSCTGQDSSHYVQLRALEECGSAANPMRVSVFTLEQELRRTDTTSPPHLLLHTGRVVWCGNSETGNPQRNGHLNHSDVAGQAP